MGSATQTIQLAYLLEKW